MVARPDGRARGHHPPIARREPAESSRADGATRASARRLVVPSRLLRGKRALGVISRYREHLPVGPTTPEVDLKEGSTPLVESRNIGRTLGLKHLYFKYEGLNPTGSLKDRRMVAAVAKAPEPRHHASMCA